MPIIPHQVHSGADPKRQSSPELATQLSSPSLVNLASGEALKKTLDQRSSNCLLCELSLPFFSLDLIFFQHGIKNGEYISVSKMLACGPFMTKFLEKLIKNSDARVHPWHTHQALCGWGLGLDIYS